MRRVTIKAKVYGKEEIPEEEAFGYSREVLVYDLENELAFIGIYDHDYKSWLFNNDNAKNLEEFVWMDIPKELKSEDS